MRATTYNNYETLIRLHIKPYIGETKLNKLTTLQIQKLYNRLLTEGRFDRQEAKDQPKGLSGCWRSIPPKDAASPKKNARR